MIRWLFTKIFGCFRKCEWETIRTVNVYDVNVSREIPTARDYELRCKTCGEMKRRRL